MTVAASPDEGKIMVLLKLMIDVDAKLKSMLT